MKNTVIKYLKISPDNYDDRLFQMYFNWCQRHAVSDNNLQELLANAQLNKWFMRHYAVLEKLFITDHATRKNPLSTPERNLYDYQECVSQIFKNYPKAIIDGFRHKLDFPLKITEEIYAN